MAHLDECLAAAVPHARARYGIGPGADPYRGLYIGDDLVDRLVVQSINGPTLREAALSIWPQLSTGLCSEPLDAFETGVVMLALAPDIDLKYERIYGYLQDDVNARRPRVSLALDLFCGDLQSRLAARDRFSPDAPLRRNQIITLDGDDDRPLLARALRLSPQPVRHLVGGAGLDERVASACEVVLPDLEETDIPLDESNRAAVHDVAQSIAAGRHVRVALVGEDLGVLAGIAAEFARAAELPTLRLQMAPDRDELLGVVAVESRLLGHALHVEWPTNAPPPSLAAVQKLCNGGRVVIVTTDRPRHDFETLGFAALQIDQPSAAVRRQWWHRSAPGLGAADLDRLAARYRLTGGQICAAARAATVSGTAGHRDSALDPTAFTAAARRQSRHRLEALARHVEPSASWDDLVLPAQALRALHELCDRVTYRQTVLRGWGMGRRTNRCVGVSALFAGSTGTGKTMAAQVIARELGLDLFVVDLSCVVNKYIGETEKNLEAIFTAAESTDAIVLFDEADSLMGKRSEVRDSHDRYANLEVSYLLQRMESHDGVALLATNLRQNLDDAFLRRLAFVVRFPFPEEGERRRIWSQIWPDTVPVAADVDVDTLAHRYRFSGGNIRNIAVCAAFLAAAQDRAVSWQDVMAAVEREYEKLGASAVPATGGLAVASG